MDDDQGELGPVDEECAEHVMPGSYSRSSARDIGYWQPVHPGPHLLQAAHDHMLALLHPAFSAKYLVVEAPPSSTFASLHHAAGDRRSVHRLPCWSACTAAWGRNSPSKQVGVLQDHAHVLARHQQAVGLGIAGPGLQGAGGVWSTRLAK